MPFPLRVHTSRAHPARGAPRRRRSLLPHASLPPRLLPLTPTRHSCHFSVTPPKPASICQVPPLSSRPQYPAPCPGGAPRTHDSSLSLPLKTLHDPFPAPAPLSAVPSHFFPHPLPPPRAPLPQRLLPRHPLQAQLTCAATPVPALVRLLQLEGDRGPERLQPSPGGAGGGRGRAAPPESSRPSAPRPPGTSASAARCGPRHRPPARPPASAPQRAPHSPQPPLRLLICPTRQRPAPSSRGPHWPTDSQASPPNQSSAGSSLPRG